MKISIPEPCNEEWQKMLPNEKGRFCLNCQKTVIDFTSKSNQEIIHYLKNHKNVCGRLNNTQLNTSLKPERNTTISKWHTYLLSLMAFLGIELTNTQNVKAQNITIKGQVVGRKNKPIKDCYIYLKDKDSCQTFTDNNGMFSLEIPKSDSLQKVVVAGPEFRSREVNIYDISENQPIRLQKGLDYPVMGVICTPLHKRVWWWLIRPFQRKKND